ncbi:MAG: hypothetical protein MHM6MM_007846 [Cercozoa sp. M6MM]
MRLAVGFVDDPTDRLIQIDYLLDRVADCCWPGRQVQFLLWLADRSSTQWLEDDRLRKIMEQVGLTNEQRNLLEQKQQVLRQDRENLDRIMAKIAQLRHDVREHMIELRNFNNAAISVAQPVQLARFFNWSTNPANSWLMDMLNVWWQHHSEFKPPVPVKLNRRNFTSELESVNKNPKSETESPAEAGSENFD